MKKEKLMAPLLSESAKEREWSEFVGGVGSVCAWVAWIKFCRGWRG